MNRNAPKRSRDEDRHRLLADIRWRSPIGALCFNDNTNRLCTYGVKTYLYRCGRWPMRSIVYNLLQGLDVVGFSNGRDTLMLGGWPGNPANIAYNVPMWTASTSPACGKVFWPTASTRNTFRTRLRSKRLLLGQRGPRGSNGLRQLPRSRCDLFQIPGT